MTDLYYFLNRSETIGKVFSTLRFLRNSLSNNCLERLLNHRLCNKKTYCCFIFLFGFVRILVLSRRVVNSQNCDVKFKNHVLVKKGEKAISTVICRETFREMPR